MDSKNANLLKGCSRTEGTSISEMFLDFDCATVDIIERLLCFAADKRLSIQEVLAHPFFSRYFITYFVLYLHDSFESLFLFVTVFEIQ